MMKDMNIDSLGMTAKIIYLAKKVYLDIYDSYFNSLWYAVLFQYRYL